MTVDFQTEYAEAGVIQTVAHNFKRGEFLSNEKNRLTLSKSGRDKVGYGL